MDEQTRYVLHRIFRRIPSRSIESLLKSWNCLSSDMLRAIDYTRPKWTVVENLITLCEERRLSLKHITNLEMINRIKNPDQETWYSCQLVEPEDDALSVELTQFKEQFKGHLHRVIRHVSIKIKKHEDEALWIRIAWGANCSKPNHLKPTYVVHHLHTSYVFICNLMTKHKILLYQALMVATKYRSIKDAHLSTRSLPAMRTLLLRQYQQVFPNNHLRIFQERNALLSHPCIEKEHANHEEIRHQLAHEAFGDNPVPKLETAVYRLETRYRGNGNNTFSDNEEFFRGVVMFSSSSLLQSLRHCVASGMAEGPVTPLLSAITQRGRNYFVITDKGSGVAS